MGEWLVSKYGIQDALFIACSVGFIAGMLTMMIIAWLLLWLAKQEIKDRKGN